MGKIDFSKIGSTAPEPSQTITDPRDLFNALPKKDPALNYLRGPQDQVLARWNQRRADRDIVIKINTGGGKTLVAILIAQSLLNERIYPVAYLVPDKFLVSQVRAEADRLGVATADKPSDKAFQTGKAVLIGTFATVFNGLSVFGVEGTPSKPPRFNLEALVVDDAHACATQADQAFRLNIPSETKEYEDLFNLFCDDLRKASPTGVLDLEDGRRSALQEVPFWAWQDKQNNVMEILHPVSNHDEFKFVWPLVADRLHLCTAVFTADAIEIQAPLHPTDLISGFSGAKRRVYLTASLTDDSVLVRHFQATQKSATTPIFPSSAADIGDRMILIPQDLCPTIKDEDIRDYLSKLAESQNVVVIVPSYRRANWWRQCTKLILTKDNIHDGVEQLKANPRLGLVVLVNRYDGIDLPEDACHILAIDGLPEAWNGIERLEEAQLRGSAGMLARQIERLEQGMGRATRSNEDYSVVILMGARLTERLNQPEARDLFSPATRTQLEIAERITTKVAVKNVDDLTDVIYQCLERDSGWIAYSRGILAEVRYEAPIIGVDVEAERLAFNAACLGDIDSARNQQMEAIEALKNENEPRRALLTQRLASYVHAWNKTEAQDLQRIANANNRNLLRPLTGIQYHNLAKSEFSQGENASTWLIGQYATGNDLVVGFNALIQDLSWDPAHTRQFEQAVADLGCHLGLKTQRPDDEYGEGPDDLWALDGGEFLVIEAKSGADHDHPVKKNDAKQLSNSMDWFRHRYPNSKALPVLVHPEARFAPGAAVPVGCRVIDVQHLDKLRQTLERVAIQLANDNAYRDSARVRSILLTESLRVTASPTKNTFIHRFTTAPK